MFWKILTLGTAGQTVLRKIFAFGIHLLLFVLFSSKKCNLQNDVSIITLSIKEDIMDIFTHKKKRKICSGNRYD